ncbi:MAG TPA: Hpt domain-containing protein [Gemmatimonadales bacterium]|nr:Hpt domain-containing protein [Gemmatimonadales bacterium]
MSEGDRHAPSSPDGAYRELQRGYLEEVPKAFAELRALLESLRRGDPVLPALKIGFHRLAGSGGSYGFPEISQIARAAEQLASAESSPDQAAGLEEAVRQLEVVRARLATGP